jgi:hypothetical protein
MTTSRRMRRFATLFALVTTCYLVGSGGAVADGDPASDYLITQPAFLPFDAHVDKASANELARLLAASKKAGLEIRVAVISSKIDLGAVPILYRRPQTYARFLGQELYYWYKHELLVVMPNGYGVYRHGVVPPADRAAVAKLAPPGTTSGTTLVDAANRAVRALAAKHAVELPSATATAGSSSGPNWLLVTAGVLAGALLVGGLVYLQRRR